MDAFARVLLSLVTENQAYVYVGVIVALFVTGIGLIIPSRKLHEAVLSFVPFIIIGCVVALGAVQLGEWLAAKSAF